MGKHGTTRHTSTYENNYRAAIEKTKLNIKKKVKTRLFPESKEVLDYTNKKRQFVKVRSAVYKSQRKMILQLRTLLRNQDVDDKTKVSAMTKIINSPSMLKDLNMLENEIKSDDEQYSRLVDIEMDLNLFLIRNVDLFQTNYLNAITENRSRDSGVWVEDRRLGNTRCGDRCIVTKAKKKKSPESRKDSIKMPGNVFDI